MSFFSGRISYSSFLINILTDENENDLMKINNVLNGLPQYIAHSPEADLGLLQHPRWSAL